MGKTLDERFAEACGAAGPLRLALEGPGAEGAVCRTLPNPFAVIGRDPDMDLRLEHPDVSRRHAYLQVVAGRLYCVDLQSRTGTFWGGKPSSWGWVGAAGLGVGPFHLRPWGDVADGPGAGGDPEPISREFKQKGLAETYLVSLGPSDGQQPEWRLSRSLVLVGRSRACKVKIKGLETSTFHCSLVQTPAGVWVVDLLSSKGTFVNDVRVRSARLGEGDEVRVGDQRFRFRIGLVALPALRAKAGGVPSAGPAIVPVVEEASSAPARRTDLPEPLIRMLLEESGRMQRELAERMQQNMADQFQQALMMMFRMFSGMHQEQMALIRDELTRIHELTEAQQSLQAELARRSAPRGGPSVLRLVGDESPPLAEGRNEPEAGPAHPAPGPGPGPAPPPAAGEGPSQPRPLGGQASEDFHAALIEQIASLQTQRHGRWQRILSAMMGEDAGGALP